jgi:hypothetical protein
MATADQLLFALTLVAALGSGLMAGTLLCLFGLRDGPERANDWLSI